MSCSSFALLDLRREFIHSSIWSGWSSSLLGWMVVSSCSSGSRGKRRSIPRSTMEFSVESGGWGMSMSKFTDVSLACASSWNWGASSKWGVWSLCEDSETEASLLRVVFGDCMKSELPRSCAEGWCENEGREALERAVSFGAVGISTATVCVVRLRFGLRTLFDSGEAWELATVGVLSRFLFPCGGLFLEIPFLEVSLSFVLRADRRSPPVIKASVGGMVGGSGWNDGLTCCPRDGVA